MQNVGGGSAKINSKEVTLVKRGGAQCGYNIFQEAVEKAMKALNETVALCNT